MSDQYDEVPGLMFCTVHDDFAAEGFDYSDICHDKWAQETPGECVLVSLFVKGCRGE